MMKLFFILLSTIFFASSVMAMDAASSKRTRDDEILCPNKRQKTEHDNYKTVAVVYRKSLNRETKHLVVPRQGFVRKAINDIFLPNYFVRDEEILPYVSTQKNDAVVAQLKIFCYEGVPDMNNGHVKDGNALCVQSADDLKRESWRASKYVYSVGKNGEIFGCIEFSILPLSQQIRIERLAIRDDKQALGLGSSLVQLALFVGSLYGYDVAELESTLDGVRCYSAHGFAFYSDSQEHYSFVVGTTINFLSAQANRYVALPSIAELTGDYLEFIIGIFPMRFDSSLDEHAASLDARVAKHAPRAKKLSEVLAHNKAIARAASLRQKNYDGTKQ